MKLQFYAFFFYLNESCAFLLKLVISISRMSHQMVEVLSKVAKQNNITNTRLREISKQSRTNF